MPTDDLKSPRSVHTIHINVGTGDGAIHLLVDEDGKNLINGKPVVHRAVLIDGGEHEEHATDSIEEVIRWIETTYSFPDGETKLRFDSVVITHWDRDHVNGVYGLIRRSINAQLVSNTTFTTTLSKPIKELAKFGQCVHKIQCPLFKYKTRNATNLEVFDKRPPAAINSTDLDNLQTTVYVAYIGTKAGQGEGLDFAAGRASTFFFGKKAYPKWITNEESPYDFSPTGAQNNTLAMCADMYYMPTTGKKRKKPVGFKFRLFHLAKLAGWYQHYLGVEIFTNTILQAGKWASIKTPNALIRETGLPLLAGPRMFIVAGDQVVIGDLELGPPAPAVHTHKFVVDKTDAVVCARPTGDRPSTPPSFNMASIATMIVSSLVTPTATTPTNTGARATKLWHYSAGDAWWDVESALAGFIDSNKPATADQTDSTAFVKLSHHGAISSNPISIFVKLQPLYVISPSSRDEASHCHPRPEVVMWIHAQNEVLKLTNNNKSQMRFVLYNWPIWFSDVVNPKVKPLLEGFVDKGPAARNYRDALSKQYEAAGMKTSSPYAKWMAEIANETKSNPVDPKKSVDPKAEQIVKLYTGLKGPLQSILNMTKAELEDTARRCCGHLLKMSNSGAGTISISLAYLNSTSTKAGAGTVLSVALDTPHPEPVPPPIVSPDPTVTGGVPSGTEEERPLKASKKRKVDEVRPSDMQEENLPQHILKQNKITPSGIDDMRALIEAGGQNGDIDGDGDSEAGSNMSLDPAHFTTIARVGNFNFSTLPLHPRLAANAAESSSTLPVRTLPVRATTGPASQPPPSTFHFLCGSGITFDTNVIDSDSIFAVSDTFESNFINWLPSQCLKLKDPIAFDVSDPSRMVYPIDVKDSWMASIVRNGLGIIDANITGSVSNSLFQTSRLSVPFVVSLKHGSEITPKTFPAINFSTDWTLYATDTSATKAPSSLSSAVAGKFGAIVLGMDPTSAFDGFSSFSVTDFLDYFGMSWHHSSDTLLLSLIGAQPLAIDLNLSAGHRNTLCFESAAPNQAWLRLKFPFKNSITESLHTAFPFLSSLSFDNTSLIGIKRASCALGRAQGDLHTSVALESTVKFGSDLSVLMTIKFGFQSVSVVLNFEDPKNLAGVVEHLASLVGLSDHTKLSPSAILGSKIVPEPSDFSVWVHKVDLTVDSARRVSMTITTEVRLFSTTFKLAISVASTGSISLTAALWTSTLNDRANARILPQYENWDFLLPKQLDMSNDGVADVSQILGSSVKLPSWMNIDLVVCQLELDATINTGGSYNLCFFGTMMSSLPTDPNSSVPKIVFGDLRFYLYYASDGEHDLQLSCTTFLVPRLQDFKKGIVAGALTISIENRELDDTGAVWIVEGAATDISLATIYELFDDDANDSMVDMLGHFSIRSMIVRWIDSSGNADLFVDAVLRIGHFDLALDYQYSHSPPGWTFKATLGFEAEDRDLVHLLADLIPGKEDSHLLDDLKAMPFLSTLKIPKADPTSTSDPLVHLIVSKQKGEAIVMYFQVAIETAAGTLSFTFVQMREHPAADPNAPASTKPTAPPGWKRIIRIMLDKLPSLPKIPVVGQIDQPFDTIDYVWASDTTPVKNNSVSGFTESELQTINSVLTNPDDKIPYRAVKGMSSAGGADPVALFPGHHFMLGSQGQIVLDHLFSKPPPPPGPQTAVSLKISSSDPAPMPTSLTQDSGTTTGKASKTTGPLTITGFGLRVKNGYLYAMIDASIMLGPIKLTLVGFGIGISLKFPFNDLKSLKISDFDIVLDGMSVLFDKPPVLIAGAFIHEQNPDYEAYKGGLALSILPYTLEAVGEYQHTFKDKDGHPVDIQSVFMFARLDGPLFTLEFAEISGVEAAFGFNYSIARPEVTDIINYPLVQGVTAIADPMQALQQFGNYVTVSKDTFWFAAGLKVDAFEILTVDAAAVIQFGADSATISIIAIASASMPPKMKDRREMFVYAELGIEASLDILGGTFTVQACLTPNSFIIHPDCHLTGGFAMCYWFHGSPYEGDFVFTVGGYHPAFKPPSYYPQNVAPVGISWNLSDVLTISGGAYFAVTPKAVMGGGFLDAVFSSGPIYAHFRAWASFLMNFSRFFFMADIGVSLSVGFHADIGIIHISIDVDVGASLHLQGPQFGGVAHVDIHIASFDVYFGDQGTKDPKLSWAEFLEVVMQQRPDAPATGGDASSSQAKASSSAVLISIEEGLASDKITSATTTSGDKWFVRAGQLKFRIECKVPISDMTLSDVELDKTKKSLSARNDLCPGKIPEQHFWARLTQGDELTSMLTVDVTSPFPSANKDGDKDNPFHVTPLIKKVPASLWTQYNDKEDPIASKLNNIDGLLSSTSTADTTVPLLMGFTFTPPDPHLPSDSDPDQDFPEYNAISAMSEGVFEDGSTPIPRKNPLLPPPTEGNTRKDDRPVLHPTPPTQNACLPAPPSATPWDDVVRAWKAADVEAAQFEADVLTTLLGWNAAPPGTVTARPDPGLSGKVPVWMTVDEAAFEEYFAACPLVCQPVA